VASAVLAFAKLRPGRIVSRKTLYRRSVSSVTALLIFFISAAVPRSLAQEGRPQIVPQRNRPQENKKPKGKEPRAVGVLQLDSGGKGTLVPIAILIDGKFYDASAYKADPIPMALESGTVYEAEQSGDSQGLFTINGALHSKSPGSAHPWLGTGTYLPHGAEAPKTMHKAEDVPVGVDNSGDEPPRLKKRDASKPAATPDSSSTSAPGGSGSPDKSGSKVPASSQPASGSPAGSSSGQETPKPANSPVPDKPADASAKQPAPAAQTSPGQASPSQPAPSQTTPAQTSPAETSTSPSSEGSYYRPTLRRGKPTQPVPEDEDNTASKKSGKTDTQASATAASAGPLQMVAAISDAAGPDPQSYKFFWKSGEEEERRNQMLALAGDEVRAYAAALVRNQIPARPVTPKAAAGRKVPPKAAQPVFENIQFRGFDVWLTNQPVLILSAEAHVPGAAGAAAAAEPYSVMLVARTDIYGNLSKLYSGVTDRFHLDVTPRLELIDVVDADGDGRGELLFRETSDAGSGYLIYRATADKLWKMFDSLNAE